MRLAVAVLLLSASPALSHDWYTKKIDPVFKNGCCGVSDCAVLKIEPGMLTGEADGYRVRLTAEQAAKINPLRKHPVDTLIIWERIQPSEDGNFHLCLRTYDPVPAFGSGDDPRGSAYCFFAPPQT